MPIRKKAPTKAETPIGSPLTNDPSLKDALSPKFEDGKVVKDTKGNKGVKRGRPRRTEVTFSEKEGVDRKGHPSGLTPLERGTNVMLELISKGKIE